MAIEKIISDLTGEINAARGMILYYENQILRKELAIAEMMDLRQRQPESTVVTAPPATVMEIKTMPQMMAEILPELNGSTFHYPEIKALLLKRFPAASEKIHARQNIYNVVATKLKSCELIRVPGGFQRAH